jgi:hypothetical protein
MCSQFPNQENYQSSNTSPEGQGFQSNGQPPQIHWILIVRMKLIGERRKRGSREKVRIQNSEFLMNPILNAAMIPFPFRKYVISSRIWSRSRKI